MTTEQNRKKFDSMNFEEKMRELYKHQLIESFYYRDMEESLKKMGRPENSLEALFYDDMLKKVNQMNRKLEKMSETFYQNAEYLKDKEDK